MSQRTPAGPPSLAAFCTIGVGGPAQQLIRAKSEEQLVTALDEAASRRIPTFILGGGSNVVFHDDGFEGWVIQPTASTLTFQRNNAKVRVVADAGVRWDQLVRESVQRGLVGIEAMSGIPGHVGAAPIQNIGAYGQELSHTLVSVRAYDRRKKEIVTLSGADCQFSYRDSLFKRAGMETFVILQVELELRRSSAPIALRYGDLHTYFGQDEAPNAPALREAVLAIRRRKGMVFSPDDQDSHSVGSFFLNPVLSASKAEALQERALAAGLPSPPTYLQDDGSVKLPAAWLMQYAGIEPGLRRGSAGISSKHVLALMNPGQASAADIRALAYYVRMRVRERWGVELIPEVRVMTPTGLDASFYDV